MRLNDLNATARKAWVRTTADAILSTTAGLLTTPELAAKVTALAEPGDFGMIASTLTAIARDGHAAARKDGPVVKRYGKDFGPAWTWGSRKARPSPVAADDEWTIPGQPAPAPADRWEAIARDLGMTVAEAKAHLKGATT